MRVEDQQRLRRIERLRYLSLLPSEDRIDELTHALCEALKVPGASLPQLIREISFAYRRNEYAEQRHSAARALVLLCRSRDLLDQLALCWQIGAKRQLKRAHWFALALLEACETLLLGTPNLEPWFLPLVRLTQALTSYAEYGYICDSNAGCTVRQNRRFAQHLILRVRRLVRVLKSFRHDALNVGGIDTEIAHLMRSNENVRQQLRLATQRNARIDRLKTILETKALARALGTIPVLNQDLYKPPAKKPAVNSRAHLPS